MFPWHRDTIPPYCAQDFIFALEMSDLPKSQKKISDSQKQSLAKLIQAHNEKKYSLVIELATQLPKGIRFNPRMIECVNNAERKVKQI